MQELGTRNAPKSDQAHLQQYSSNAGKQEGMKENHSDVCPSIARRKISRISESEGTWVVDLAKGDVEEKRVSGLRALSRSTTRAIKVHRSPNVKNSIALITTILTLISDPSATAVIFTRVFKGQRTTTNHRIQQTITIFSRKCHQKLNRRQARVTRSKRTR